MCFYCLIFIRWCIKKLIHNCISRKKLRGTVGIESTHGGAVCVKYAGAGAGVQPGGKQHGSCMRPTLPCRTGCIMRIKEKVMILASDPKQ